MRLLLVLAAASLAFASSAAAATITVTSTADSGPGTLHQALIDSNTSVGVLDTIAFNIPGAGIHTITVSTDLPTATDPVIIDGTTQPGYAGTPLIELTESVPTQGPRISAGGSTVRGLAIFEFGVQLTFISNGGNAVEACYIGINATATVTSTGLGLQIQNSPDTVIGGTDGSAGNVISGLTGNGIQLVASDNTIIRGNLIGTDPTGTAALGNNVGISVVNSDDVVIGGTVSGMGNLISNNGGYGITVSSGCADTLIAGNLIGTDVTGTQPMPNNFGIDANNLDGPITIGTPAAAGRNIISGNNIGMILNNGVHGATVQNNYFGTDISGTLPLPNNVAILLNTADTTDVLIGGPNPGEGNVIVFNEGASNIHGIWSFGKRITVRGNRIHDNEGLGFDNEPGGVNPNDPGDADGGANDGQNFPIVTSVEVLSGPQGVGTRVVGVLRSEASTQYILDFYGNSGCASRPQDFLEAQTYLGFGQVTTDASGAGNFDVTLSAEITPGDFVSATATDPDGSTSEFSQRLPFNVLPVSGPPEGGTAITINGTDFASGATVTLGGVAATNVVIGSNQITAQTPVLTAGTVNDLKVTNLDGTTGTLPKAFVSDFLDVPNFNQFHTYVTVLVRNAITAGIGNGLYGVNQSTLRQQMAVFLLKARYGICYVPPPCVGVFSDVPCPSTFANWVEDLADQGITGGCGAGIYCPQNPVRRDQMAVFLLKTKYGSAYLPPPCDGDFDDVPCPSQFAAWIEQLAEEQITTGCGGDNYCPLNPNTRGQMAVFLVKTFALE